MDVGTDEFVPVLSNEYLILLAIVFSARAADFISTWIATPNLLLEANPLARKLGWKWSLILNFVVASIIPIWPLPSVVIATTSILVAARNLQSAWVMRSMGEGRYRLFMSERFAETRPAIYLTCVLGQSGLLAALGGALMFFSGLLLVPFGVGMGLITYSVAISVFTLSYSRRWRRGA